jgi:SAM-dependent methyltransferase
MSQTEITDEARTAVRGLIQASRLTQIVHASAKLGIADLVAAGVDDAAALAGRTGAHHGGLRRLLRAMVALGLLADDGGERLRLTPMGQCLRSDVPESLHPVALLFGRDPLWQAWGRLAESVMTGEPIARPQTERAFLDRHVQDPEYGAIFDAAMTTNTVERAAAIVEAYDFSGLSRIVDVGGGQGALLTAILQGAPEARGVLFDLPPVVAAARARIESAGLGYRCEVVAGDCFEGVPAGGDAYVLKVVLHDWDDARALAILRNCRRACAPGARVLVIEPVMPDRMDSSDRARDIALADLNMLVGTGGRERTEAEFHALYHRAGFRLVTVIPTSSSLSIVEGIGEA